MAWASGPTLRAAATIHGRDRVSPEELWSQDQAAMAWASRMV